MRNGKLSIAILVALVASLFGGVLSLSASHHVTNTVVHYDAIYYPWLPYDDTIDGVDGWHGSITVQNITQPGTDNRGVRIWVFTDEIMHDVANKASYSFANGLADAETFLLAPHASQTITPQQLGLSAPGSGLTVYAAYNAALNDAQSSEPLCEEAYGDIANFGNGTCYYSAPTIAGVQKSAASVPMGGGTQLRTSDAHITVDGYTAIPFVDVSWGSQSGTCHTLAGGVDFCDGAGYYISPGGFGPGWDFDGHSYLPIVQTNDGWNTHLYITNVDATQTTAASVDVTLITTDQQGYGASGAHKWAQNIGVGPGQTYVLDVSSVVGDGWVGSAHITSEVGVVTAAMRSKPATNMQMTNTSAPSLWANPGAIQLDSGEEVEFSAVGVGKYEQYAPLVFVAYNGWNTGFSFVNNAEATNTVTVTYYGPTGNVIGGDSRTISPLGQEFIYAPASQDLNLGGLPGQGFVGSAVFSSDLPFHIAVDQVKYSTGEALSYLATAAGAGYGTSEWPAPSGESGLALPLVMKGSQDGHGDISGLQFFNANAHYPVSAQAVFYAQSGNVVGPTQDTYYPITLGALHSFTLYSLTLTEMSQNQVSSAVIRPVDNPSGPDGQIVGVSNMVNYDVSGDGAVGFNMVNTSGNYRFPSLPLYPAYIILEHVEDDENNNNDIINSLNHTSDVAENNVTETHTVRATVYDSRNTPVPGIEVQFRVSGPNANPVWEETDGIVGTDTGYTDTAGEVYYSYIGYEDGEDTIRATVRPHGFWAEVTKIWHPLYLVGSPEADENPFFTDDEIAAIEEVIAELLGEEATQDEIDDAIENHWQTYLGEDRPNYHTVIGEIQDKDGNPYPIDEDRVGIGASISSIGGGSSTIVFDYDEDTGTLTYTYERDAEDATDPGSDTITLDVTIDGQLTLETDELTKDWTPLADFDDYEQVPFYMTLEHWQDHPDGAAEPVNPVGDWHDVMATLYDQFLKTIEDENLTASVTGENPTPFDPNTDNWATYDPAVFDPNDNTTWVANPDPWAGDTNGAGQRNFSYVGLEVGIDTIRVDVTDTESNVYATIEKEWIPANLLTNADFEDCTVDQNFLPYVAIQWNDPTTWNRWMAFESWRCIEEDGNLIAAQDPDFHPNAGPHTQSIKQAIDASDLPSGTTLELSFDYRASAASSERQVQVFGLLENGNWQPFPGPDPMGTCNNCTQLFPTPPAVTHTLPASSDWTTFSTTFTLGAQFEAIAIGINFGSNSETPPRAIDNVVLQVVPGP